MIINHNLPAMNTFRQLSTNNTNTSKSLEKLSSGLRINRAGDDAAGLAISEKMRSQIRGLDQASSNAQDGISLIQTAEGALQEVHSMLQRMKELSVQSANDTNTTYDRSQIQAEINQLTSEINRIGNTTEFNTMKLLDGSKESVINGPAPTESTKFLTKGAEFTISSSKGVTGNIILNDNHLTIGAGELANLNLSTTNTSAITLTWDKTNQKLHVVIKATVGSAPTGEQTGIGLQSGDILGYDEYITVGTDGSISYSDHGLSFAISADKLAKLTNADNLVIDLDGTNGAFSSAATGYDTLGPITTTNSWQSNSIGAQATGVKLAAGYDYESIQITGLSLGAADGTILIKALDNAGSTVVLDTITLTNAAATGDVFNYSNFGISFNLTFPTAGATGTADSFDLLLTTSPTGKNVFETQKTTVLTAAPGAITYDNSKALTFQIGANSGQGMVAGVSDMRSLALGISSKTASATVDLTQFDPTLVLNTGLTATGEYTSTARTASYLAIRSASNGSDNVDIEYALDIGSYDKATAAITIYDQAINKVSAERSKLGAMQNRLEHTITNLDSTSENLQAAESRIRDVNMAKEMMAFQKNSILAQAATAMLAQANQMPQNVLQLLR